jgi:hypothetical protein
MSILLNGEVKSRPGAGSELIEEVKCSGVSDLPGEVMIWSGEWYFAKNQINSKEFHYRRVSDSVPKNIIDYVSFTASSSHPNSKPGRGRKKSKSRETSSDPLPPAAPEARFVSSHFFSTHSVIETLVIAAPPHPPQQKLLLQVRILLRWQRRWPFPPFPSLSVILCSVSGKAPSKYPAPKVTRRSLRPSSSAASTAREETTPLSLPSRELAPRVQPRPRPATNRSFPSNSQTFLLTRG